MARRPRFMTDQDTRKDESAGEPGSLRSSVDPFGVSEAVAKVQQAWLRHPEALNREIADLGAELWTLQVHAWQRFTGIGENDAVPVVEHDERFESPAWSDNPFLDVVKEYYLLYTRWLQDLVFATPDLDEKERRKAAFWQRQFLNALAPTNYFWTNPEAIIRFVETGGRSLARGLVNLLSDAERGMIRMSDERSFRVGENLASTPGAVVHRNCLLEVIQYKPATGTVHAMPVVIVSPWINKYYILDLVPEKSLVRHLVEQGFTVFVTSWKNPDESMRDVTMDDYMLEGVLECIETARDITGAAQVHLTGYCIGGTIVSALMAWLARSDAGEHPVAHWTLLATLVDFTRPGDIDVYIDEDSVRWLESRMARTGYLDGNDMAGAFRSLRSNSLVWHYFVHGYLFGEDPPAFDVLYWNMDTTRMPAAMHSFYLREFYLHNRLARKGALNLGGHPIDLGLIDAPLYCVGTEQDHIAPWVETFKICRVLHCPVRYTLATSGHILGILSPPVQPPKRRYWTGDAAGATDGERWRESVAKVPGSWWEDWVAWLRPRAGERVAPPPLGSESHPCIEDAPGSYVMER
jgi:polyhydroxyalkanoate synthase